MSYVITTYGGGELFFLIFNGIAALFRQDQTGMVMPLIRLGLLMGSVYVVIIMLYKNQLVEGIRWLLWVLVATHLLFLPKTRIHIEDPLTIYQRDVDGVPLALGVFASLTSQMGKTVTEKLESVFTLPDYKPYHQTGTVFASSLMSQLGKFRIVDPMFKGNMERFVNGCMVYDIMIGQKYTLSDLQNTPNLWELVMRNASPALGFLYKEGNNPGQIVTCRDGAQKLNALWAPEIRRAIALYGRRIQLRELNEAAFNTELMGSARLLMGATALADSAQQLLRQEMMIGATQDGPLNKLSELGGGATYAATKALLQQRSTYAIAGEIAARTLPLFKNVIEALSYALFIFIVVLSLLPNGHRVLLTYAGILLWTQLWAPLYAVLNLMMTLYGRAETMAHAQSQGLTLLNSSAIMNANTDMVTLAAWLSVSIPFISYGIIRQGAAAFVGLAQHLGSAMESAASSAAHEAVSGNISLGNVTLGTQAYQNTSAFQHMTSPAFSDAEFKAMNASGVEQTTFAGGGQALSDHGLSLTPVTLMASVNTSWEGQQRLSEAQSLADSKTQAFGKSLEAVAQQTASLLERVGSDRFSQEAFSETTSSTQTKALQDHQQLVQDISESLNVSKAIASDLAVYAKAGASSKIFEVGGSATLVSHMTNQEALQKAQSIVTQTGYTYSLDEALSAAKTLSEGRHDTQGVELAKGASTSLNEAQHLREEATLAYSHVKDLSTSLTSSTRRDLQESRNITQDFLEYVSQQPVNVGPTGTSSSETIGMIGALSILKAGGEAYESYLERFLEDHPQYTLPEISTPLESHTLQNQYGAQAQTLENETDIASSYEREAQALQEKGKTQGSPEPLKPRVQKDLESRAKKIHTREASLQAQSLEQQQHAQKALQENVLFGNLKHAKEEGIKLAEDILDHMTPFSSSKIQDLSPKKQITQNSKKGDGDV